MDSRPVGVFDSGLGGLTTVRELRTLLPGERIVYFGDTGRVPYGTRSRETIRRYAMQDVSFLLSKGVKLIVIACNTASVALDGETLPVPSVGALLPAVPAACRATVNKRVAVIGTPATVRSGAYEKALLQADPSLSVLTVACPLFVPLVENGFTAPDDPVTRLVAEKYLTPVREFGADTLILGCTHYPVIEALIASVMGEGVFLINSGREAARAARELLLSRDAAGTGPGDCRYYVSDSTADFAENARAILGRDVSGQVERVNIESY